MRGARIFLTALLVVSGCKFLDEFSQPHIENPVMPPPPPRISMNDQDPAGWNSELADSHSVGTGSADAIRQAAGSDSESQMESPLLGSQVVATVNGTPIFASDILSHYEPHLRPARQQMSPKRYRQFQEVLLKRDLPSHIEQTLLVESLKETLSPDQVEMLEQHIGEKFEENLNRLKKEAGVSTRPELEHKLQEQGTSLENLKRAFVQRTIASQFLAEKMKSDYKVSRRDLVEYYQSHREEYRIPGRVKWQQIVVSYDKNGGKQQARRVLDEALAELEQGTDFGEVARKYSNGPTAKFGGVWDWTSAGSLANPDVEETLFELPPGKLSRIFERQQGYELVQVIERQKSRDIPFSEVQDEIKKKVIAEHITNPQEVMEELKADAVIETVFDEDNDHASRPAADSVLR